MGLASDPINGSTVPFLYRSFNHVIMIKWLKVCQTEHDHKTLDLTLCCIVLHTILWFAAEGKQKNNNLKLKQVNNHQKCIKNTQSINLLVYFFLKMFNYYKKIKIIQIKVQICTSEPSSKLYFLFTDFHFLFAKYTGMRRALITPSVVLGG